MVSLTSLLLLIDVKLLTLEHLLEFTMHGKMEAFSETLQTEGSPIGETCRTKRLHSVIGQANLLLFSSLSS